MRVAIYFEILCFSTRSHSLRSNTYTRAMHMLWAARLCYCFCFAMFFVRIAEVAIRLFQFVFEVNIYVLMFLMLRFFAYSCFPSLRSTLFLSFHFIISSACAFPSLRCWCMCSALYGKVARWLFLTFIAWWQFIKLFLYSCVPFFLVFLLLLWLCSAVPTRCHAFLSYGLKCKRKCCILVTRLFIRLFMDEKTVFMHRWRFAALGNISAADFSWVWW